jgi:PAS domain S-box-containing protein
MLAETHVPSSSQNRELDVALDASFRAALQSMRMPVLMIDSHQAGQPVVFSNEATLRLTGYAADEIIGRSWRFMVGPGTDPEALALVEAALQQGEGDDAEILTYRKNGSSLWAALSINPVRDANGGLRLLTLTLSDVSEKKRADRSRLETERILEEQVERRTRDLQAALEQKTVLLHEVEHRVKNSLQMTASLVLLKARRIQNPEARQVLQEIAERVGALAAAHRLLYASGDVSRFNLGDFTAELADELILGLPKGQVALNLNVQPLGVPASKAAALALLLNELIGNAVKHAFPKGREGQLTIEIGRAENGLKIAVADDGVGLDHSPAPEGSFGKTLITMLVHQLKGRLTWHDMEPGTRAEIVMPVDAEETRFE